MKNSRTSQIAVLALLAISDIVCLLAKFGPTGFRYQALESPVICYLLLAILIGAIIYYIVMSKKKKFRLLLALLQFAPKFCSHIGNFCLTFLLETENCLGMCGGQLCGGA